MFNSFFEVFCFYAVHKYHSKGGLKWVPYRATLNLNVKVVIVRNFIIVANEFKYFFNCIQAYAVVFDLVPFFSKILTKLMLFFYAQHRNKSPRKKLAKDQNISPELYCRYIDDIIMGPVDRGKNFSTLLNVFKV